MVDIKHSSWTERDADNNSPSPNGIQNGYAPSTVGPILQATKAAIKRSYNQINAIYTTTGTATALVLTYAVAPGPLVKGERYAFFASQTNTGAMTLDVNGSGAKSILQQDGAALKAGQIVAGTATTVIYDGTVFRLENYVSNPKFTGTLTVDAIEAATITASGPLTAGATTVLNLTTGGTVTAGNLVSAGLTLNAAAGTDRAVGWKTAGTQRWSAFANSAPETGNNVGSDFAVARYADNGNYIDAPLFINRANGNITIEKALTVKETLMIGTAGTAMYSDGNIRFTGTMATNTGAMYLSDVLYAKAPKANPSFSGVVGLPGVSANEFKMGNADGASYSQYNIAMKGWWGMGMQDHTNAVNGYYDFRSGKWDTKGGTFKNGTEYVFPNGGMWDIAINRSASAIRDTGAVNGRAMTFNWSGQPGQPSWMWGGNDGQNMYVYNPSNFTVANSAQLGGVAASEYVKKAELPQPIGVDQTWQVVTRVIGTVYRNTTGKPIIVSYYGGGGAVIQTSLDGSTNWVDTHSNAFTAGQILIPVNNYYRWPTGSISFVRELR